MIAVFEYVEESSMAKKYLTKNYWFHFPILVVGLLVILIDCMIFLVPFVNVIRMSMSLVSFLIQLDLRNLSLQNDFLGI